MVDEGTRKTLSSIPLLQTKAGPRDKELWVNRLKEEYQALIKVFLITFVIKFLEVPWCSYHPLCHQVFRLYISKISSSSLILFYMILFYLLADGICDAIPAQGMFSPVGSFYN